MTLSAQNAPVRAILAEWARLGGATIVNGDRVVGPPVTLELTGVPERQALDIVLRSVAGYMLAPRRAGSIGASMFDRILILPTSVAPQAARAGSRRAAGVRHAAPGHRAPRQPEPSVEVTPTGLDDIDTERGTDDGSPPPRPGDPRASEPPFVMRPPVQPGTRLPDDPADADDAEEPNDGAPAGVAPTPSNPFGIPVGSSATPGVVTPAPQPQQQRTEPRTTQRPRIRTTAQ